MSIKKFVTKSVKETQDIAGNLVLEILKLKSQKGAIILALSGELGSGKTTFLQGFAKKLGIKEKILSPTFILMKKFKIPKQILKKNTKYKILNTKYSFFYHFDCYRLENEKDLESLGFKEIISNSKNIVAIEWPEKIKEILPKDILEIQFKHLEDNKREIIIDSF